MSKEAYFFSLWLKRKDPERIKMYLATRNEWCKEEEIAYQAMLALAED